MGYYCITALWVILTILFTIGIIFTMLSPVWFEVKNYNNLNNNNNNNKKLVSNSALENNKNMNNKELLLNSASLNSNNNNNNNDTIITFGLLRYCNYYELTETNILYSCKFYQNFNEIPSIAWIISIFIYSMGTGLLLLSLLLSLFGICLKKYKATKLRIGIAFIQVIGVGLLSISVLMFPLGLDSKFARGVCGKNAGMFKSGECQIAWGYVLGIMAISLTIFLPILAKYSTEQDNEDDEEDCYSYDFTDHDKSEKISLTSTSKVTTTV